MPIISGILRICIAVALLITILIAIFFVLRMTYPYFRDNDIVLYNNTQSSIRLCEHREHESKCSDIEPKSQEKISIKNIHALSINKDYIFKISREVLSELQRSEIYCESKERCLYAFQLENGNLIYSLRPSQAFPVTEFAKQPRGFPLEIHVGL